MVPDSIAEEKKLLLSIATVLDEAKLSNATHSRKIKELLSILARCGSSKIFLAAFCKCIKPVFIAQRRAASTERVVRFLSEFARSSPSTFLEEFLRFLLTASLANLKTVRFRSCQIISEVIMRLPDDAEASGELWDELIESMKIRVQDKIPLVRIFAIRSLSRFINDAENVDVLELFLQVLPDEQNAEVRKTIVLALPPSNAALECIIDCTLDVSESVRKATYFVLASKFPIQSLSIKQRAIVLRRGLTDRSESVSKECLRLMRDTWLVKCCDNDPLKLLKYLDIETYESVGEIAMKAIFKDEGVKESHVDKIRNQVMSHVITNEGEAPANLLEPEASFYWRIVCSRLQNEARAKGADAAATSGTEAEVHAAEATDKNDLVESILPPTTSDFVALVQHHIDAGLNHLFSSRQLLLLGSTLDYSDMTSQKVVSAFLLNLLQKPLHYELDEKGNKVPTGDGVSLGGDKTWADAVSHLLQKVHASPAQFEHVVLHVIEELSKPCRERTADFMHWMHCLSLTSLFLEHATISHWLSLSATSPSNLLHSLLLPGAKHSHLDVQRAAVRCLGLFGLMEAHPNDDVAGQLKSSFVDGATPVSIMACKALFDFCMWHGVSDLLGLFYDKMETKDDAELSESETVVSVIAEGFCKILLLSNNYKDLSPSLHPLVLAKLVRLYFGDEAKDLERLKQCLSVFFGHYPSVSASHKTHLSKAFIPAMRSMWPGIFGNSGGSAFWVSTMRKRAAQASLFMLQMMQSPLYDAGKAESGYQEEDLALRIAAEVAGFPARKSAAEKAYMATLCRVLGSLTVRTTDRTAVKLMTVLLKPAIESVSSEKDIARELTQLADRVRQLDCNPEEEICKGDVEVLLERMDLKVDLDSILSFAAPQTPCVARSARGTRQRRQTTKKTSDSSDEEFSAASVAVTGGGLTGPRSQRASKTAAISKMMSSRRGRIEESENEGLDDSEEDDDDSEDSETIA